MLGQAYDALSIGIKMGREAKRLFPIKFEEMINIPIQDVRKDLNITPVKDGLVTWY